MQEALGIDWSPISFDGSTFHLQERPVKAPEIVKPKTPSQPFRIRAHVNNNSINGTSPARSPNPEQPVETSSIPTKAQVVNAISHAPGPDVTAMEDMVNNLINHEPVVENSPTPRSFSQMHSPQLNSSSMLVGTERSSPGPLNIMDIVRNMSQRSAEPLAPPTISLQGSHRLSNPSLPAIWSTAFTPRHGEATASTTRPGTASSLSSGQQQRSSALFQQELLQREREIQMRSSPPVTMDFSSWSATGGVQPNQQQQPWKQGTRSPWDLSNRSPLQNHRQVSQAAPFGAIGERRRHDTHTPTSGYSG